MAIWLHTKTQAQCRATKQAYKSKVPYFPKTCRICGKEVSKGTYCTSCQRFIAAKLDNEKKGQAGE